MSPDQAEHPDEGAYDTIYDMIVYHFPHLKVDEHEDAMIQLTEDFLNLIKTAEGYAAKEAISAERANMEGF